MEEKYDEVLQELMKKFKMEVSYYDRHYKWCGKATGSGLHCCDKECPDHKYYQEALDRMDEKDYKMTIGAVIFTINYYNEKYGRKFLSRYS